MIEIPTQPFVPLEITQATVDDADDIADTLTAGALRKIQHGDNIWLPRIERGDFTGKVVREWIERDNNFYIGRLGQVAAATFSLSWENKLWGEDGQDGNAGYVAKLAVGDRARGRSPEILDWINDRVAVEGREFIRLDCPPILRPLYERNGFTWIRDEQDGKFLEGLFQRRVQIADDSRS